MGFVFLGRLLYAPYHFLKKAQDELADYKAPGSLELNFDPADAAYVRQLPSLHGPLGEQYFIGIQNPGSHTLYDVTIRALDSWMTRVAIATAQTGHSTGSHDSISVYRKDSLHPAAPEFVELFGLSYDAGGHNPENIFNTVQRFTLEAFARDAKAIRKEFEYDPKARPMLRMLP